jgi:hypothetical protein
VGTTGVVGALGVTGGAVGAFGVTIGAVGTTGLGATGAVGVLLPPNVETPPKTAATAAKSFRLDDDKAPKPVGVDAGGFDKAMLPWPTPAIDFGAAAASGDAGTSWYAPPAVGGATLPNEGFKNNVFRVAMFFPIYGFATAFNAPTGLATGFSVPTGAVGLATGFSVPTGTVGAGGAVGAIVEGAGGFVTTPSGGWKGAVGAVGAVGGATCVKPPVGAVGATGGLAALGNVVGGT